MRSADAQKRIVIYRLRIDRNAADPQAFEHFQLLAVDRIRPTRFHSVLQTERTELLKRIRQNVFELICAQHSWRAPAHIERANAQAVLLNEFRARLNFAFQRNQVFLQPRLLGEHFAWKRAVQAFCPAERNADVKIDVVRRNGA
ncbi:hypothetical protein SDC9_68100 [bioreactor metagenome]|uniref:Uncharacterized protein n=1 Tax=bioreactor metagenome TaxID=1076179 RepID=A0A644XZH9_9ZZZZ